MKKLILGLILLICFGACTDQESEKYTGKSVEFQLYQASEFEFVGKALIKELIGGNLELSIQLEGARGDSETNYPAHLHFGNYTDADAPIAFMLDPVRASDLKSSTILEQLSDGSRLTFEEVSGFDGHIKVHLAADGPDYEVILVAGNIGLNAQSGFNVDEMAVCGKSY
ncbi:hypothetical protein [Algoriphagus sp.]|uniref:hypothetical protein n=1 Tax=Algoriphagus sp. TaxID=1872435 RepID=UPI002633BE80|nr:hypothetical protein [Algoriphagus sp.]